MGTTPPKINAKNKFWHKPHGYDGETLTGKTSMGGLKLTINSKNHYVEWKLQ